MPDANRPLPPDAVAALVSGRKIEAIKIVRQEWGTDLKDSKAAVDAYIKTRPDLAAATQTGSGQSYLLGLIVALAAVVAAYLFLRSR